MRKYEEARDGRETSVISVTERRRGQNGYESTSREAPYMAFPQLQAIMMDGEERIVVTGFMDSENIIAGLSLKSREAVLLGVWDAFNHAVARGPGLERRRELFVQYVAYEILFQVVEHKQLIWGRDRLRFGHSVTARRLHALASRRARDNSERYALLDLIDWDLVDPWFIDLPLPAAMRRQHQQIRAELFDVGPFVPSMEIHVEVLKRLHEAYGVPHTRRSPRDWRRALSQRRHIIVGNTGIQYRAQLLTPILAYYGIGTPGRDNQARGFHIRHWCLERLLQVLENRRDIDLRHVSWMHDRYVRAYDLLF